MAVMVQIPAGRRKTDEAFAIVCEIYYILRRNPDEKFLRKALTRILAIEKVMYNGQQSNTES